MISGCQRVWWLTGGGAKMRDIDKFVREILQIFGEGGVCQLGCLG